MDNTVWRSRVAALVEATLSRPRLSHSREVARLACELCDRFRVDEDKGYIAGIAHDLAREKEPAEMVSLCEADGLAISDLERANPLLLHGRASAFLLQRLAGFADPEVLEAVRDHVTGRGGMGPLSRILFVADFLEPTRDFVSPEFRRRTSGLSLNEMVLAVLERKMHYVRAASAVLAPQSLALHRELKENAG
jgi:predicted HD superfamily hydrolase involved in NAD metabolism